MKDINISIIGAGSVYTPELIEGLAENKHEINVKKIILFDINTEKLKVMTDFCKRYVSYLDLKVEISSTTNRVEAIKEANFINIQIRVGGNEARVLDEKIPLKYGVIGQETTGAGGFMKGLRTIPSLISIAKDVEKYNPEAWIMNYTNPAGLVTEAVNKHTNAKIVGLCAGGMRPQQRTSKVLNIPRNKIRYDLVGLNHLQFAYNLTIEGRNITNQEFNKVANDLTAINSTLVKELRMIPSSYLQYYYHTTRKVEELKNSLLTRGEQVLEMEEEIFRAYADSNKYTKPEVLTKRGGGGYSEVAIGTMKAMLNDDDTWLIVNVANEGTISTLPDDAVIETPCMINKSGIKPLNIGKLPKKIWGIIDSVKNYEQLTIESAMSGDKETALLALMAHPLVKDYDIAQPLLDEMLEANKKYLPRFF